jgi:excisionase family DNA binding protein
MNSPTPEVLTTYGLAERLGCHPDTVRRMARTGDIPFMKIGVDYRFAWDDVKAALTPVKVDPWVNPRARKPRR